MRSLEPLSALNQFFYVFVGVAAFVYAFVHAGPVAGLWISSLAPEEARVSSGRGLDAPRCGRSLLSVAMSPSSRSSFIPSFSDDVASPGSDLRLVGVTDISSDGGLRTPSPLPLVSLPQRPLRLSRRWALSLYLGWGEGRQCQI